MVSRGKVGFISIAVILLSFPLIVQASSQDAIENNVSALKVLCDRIFSAISGDERDVVGQSRNNIQPFIQANFPHESVGSGLVDEGGFVRGIALFDANGDGLIDIYITHDNRPPLMDPSSLPELNLGNALFINLGVAKDGMPEFVDLAAEAGVQEMGRKSHGASIADYDNDGRLDMYVTNGVDGIVSEDKQRIPPSYQRTYGFLNEGEGRNTLYYNEGNRLYTLADGRVIQLPIFSDKTEFAGVGDNRESESSSWSDIDNDGFVDLHVSNYIDLDFWGPRYPGLPAEYYFGERNTLYHNNGDGTFTDITESAGVGGTPRAPEFFFKGSGNGAGNEDQILVDDLGRRINTNGGASHHQLWYDYDGDLFPDLFIANDWNVIEVFHNDGDLTFTDVTKAAHLDIEGAWMQVSLWDYNQDGKPDLYATNFGAGAFAATHVDDEGRLKFTRFTGVFQNDGVRVERIDGADVPVPIFSYVSDEIRVDWSKTLPPYGLTLRPECHGSLTKATGFELGEFGWGAVFPDIDNDGDQDVYWVGGLKRGDPNAQTLSLESPGRLLRNDGNGILTDISVESRVLNLVGVNYRTGERIDLRYSEKGSGLAAGDLNNDGFPDLIVTNDADFTPFGHDVENSLRDDEIVEIPSFLFINPGGDNNWLKVKLEGTVSNRAAIGAKVKVTLEDGNAVTRFVMSGDVTGGQNPFELLFGLGKSEVSRIEVMWPSGMIDTIENPRINGLIEIVEGSS